VRVVTEVTQRHATFGAVQPAACARGLALRTAVCGEPSESRDDSPRNMTQNVALPGDDICVRTGLDERRAPGARRYGPAGRSRHGSERYDRSQYLF